jgi:cytochrome c2
MRFYEMGPSMRKAGLVLMAVLGSSPTALAAGDSSAGQTVFATHCVACHSTQPGKNEVAPSLAGIVGSKSASVPGYDFSPAMKDANITWDDANLDKFLANPAGFIPRDQDVHQSPQRDRSAECHCLSQHGEEMSRLA